MRRSARGWKLRSRSSRSSACRSILEDKKDEAALDKAIDQALEGAQSPGDKGEKGAGGKSKAASAYEGLQQPL